MRNVYKELKEKDYDLYQKAIVFAGGLIENIKSDYYGKDRDACIEEEIVKYTLHLTTASTGQQ